MPRCLVIWSKIHSELRDGVVWRQGCLSWAAKWRQSCQTYGEITASTINGFSWDTRTYSELSLKLGRRQIPSPKTKRCTTRTKNTKQAVSEKGKDEPALLAIFKAIQTQEQSVKWSRSRTGPHNDQGSRMHQGGQPQGSTWYSQSQWHKVIVVLVISGKVGAHVTQERSPAAELLEIPRAWSVMAGIVRKRGSPPNGTKQKYPHKESYN